MGFARLAKRVTFQISPTKLFSEDFFQTFSPQSSTIRLKGVRHFATMNRQKFYHSPAVSIIVGSDGLKRTFYVHKDQLVCVSAYFRTSLNSEFVEGRTQQVELGQDDPDVFDIFVQWIYQGDYHVPKPLSKEEGGTKEAWYKIHTQAYSLGNRLVAPEFKKKIIEKLVAIFERYDDIAMSLIIEMAEIIYGGTSNEDGVEMRALLAMYCGSRVGRPAEPLYGDPRRFFSAEEMAELIHCDQQEFVADVLFKVQPGPRLRARASLQQLFPKK